MVAIGVLLLVTDGSSSHILLYIGEALLWLAAILTIVTGYDYLRAGLIHMAADHIKPTEQTSLNRERRAAEQVS